MFELLQRAGGAQGNATGKGDCAFSLTCVEDLNRAVKSIGRGIDFTTGPVRRQTAYMRDTFPVRLRAASLSDVASWRAPRPALADIALRTDSSTV
jgi:hypothetical protein